MIIYLKNNNFSIAQNLISFLNIQINIELDILKCFL